MEQYDNLNNKKIRKMDKKCETCALLHFPPLLNNYSLSELSDLEHVDESFEK